MSLSTISGLEFTCWLAFILALIAYCFYVYLIKIRNKSLEALSGVDVQLQRRHDLIPNVVLTAKKYLEHERELLEEITQLRTRAVRSSDNGASQERFDLEDLLESKMNHLFVAIEAYPELKSAELMLDVQRRYTDVEDNIAAARRFYNSAVNRLNNAVELFPSNVIASLIKVDKMPFYQASKHVRR